MNSGITSLSGGSPRSSFVRVTAVSPKASSAVSDSGIQSLKPERVSKDDGVVFIREEYIERIEIIRGPAGVRVCSVTLRNGRRLEPGESPNATPCSYLPRRLPRAP